MKVLVMNKEGKYMISELGKIPSGYQLDSDILNDQRKKAKYGIEKNPEAEEIIKNTYFYVWLKKARIRKYVKKWFVYATAEGYKEDDIREMLQHFFLEEYKEFLLAHSKKISDDFIMFCTNLAKNEIKKLNEFFIQECDKVDGECPQDKIKENMYIKEKISRLNDYGNSEIKLPGEDREI